MTALITADQSRHFYERRGLTLGEQGDDTGDCCTRCEWLTDPDDLLDLDGQNVCRPCHLALTGDDPRAPEHARDL
jgi:hypothetical protein